MKSIYAFAIAVAGAGTLNMAAFAQATGQVSGDSQSRTPNASAAQQGEQVTVVGCIQREADYRRANGAGRGGAAGTGVGVGNEFVLTNASMSPAAAGGAAAGAAATSGTNPATPTGTAGASAARGTAYELTGPNEGQVQQYVGQRVEIMGKLKPAETGAAGPTGGPTAAAPPRGVDVASQDLKLRELEIASVRPTSGTCSAQ